MKKFSKVVFALLLILQPFAGQIVSKALDNDTNITNSIMQEETLESDNEELTNLQEEMNSGEKEIQKDSELENYEGVGEIDISLEEAVELSEDAIYSDGYILYGANGIMARNAQSATVRIRSRINNTTYDFNHIVSGFSNRSANIAILEARVGNSGPWLTAFCVEVTAPYPTDQNGTEMVQGQPLSATQRQEIERVLMYGYGNISGFNANQQVSEDAFVATQVAIWEIASAGNFTGTGSPSGDIWRRIIADTGSTSNGWAAVGNQTRMNMYNQIRENFRNHTTIPSFMFSSLEQSENSVHTLRWSASNNRYQVTLNDSNSVLSHYFRGNSEDVGGYTIERSGNMITISTATANTNTYTFPPDTFRKVGSGTNTMLWVHETLQNVVTGGAGNPVTAYLSVVVEENQGQIEIQKREDTTNGSAISNAQFEVQHHNGTSWVNHGIYTTENNGNVMVPNLFPGRYRIREIAVPNPYILNSEWREITINNTGNSVTETFVNARSTGSIEIIKNSTDGDVIPGTEFRIVGNGVDKVVITGENGRVTVSDLPLLNAQTTEFTVTEIKVPAPYLIDSTPRTVELSRSQPTDSIATVSISFTNKRAQGQIEIIKYSETGELLPNTTFEIYDNVTGLFIESLTTEEDGRVQSSLLDLGSYLIKEVNVPKPHVLCDPFIVELEFKDDVTPLVIHTQEVVNELIRGGFELTKLSETKDVNINLFQRIRNFFSNSDSETLENVEFELWSLNDSEPTLIDTLITDSNGTIFRNGLLYGDYKLVETVTGNSHQLLENPIYFEIREHQVILELEVINYLTRTKIIKVDENQTPLVGATLQIINENGEVVNEWESTEEAYKIYGLDHGRYFLREVEAPIGFELAEDLMFEVTDNPGVHMITLVNDRLILTHPATGDELSKCLIIPIFGFTTSIICLLTYYNKSKIKKI